jgi:hypothetical protein
MEAPERPLTAGAAAGSAPAHDDPVVVLGSGILGHTSFERHTDRYGAVHLTVLDSIPGELAPARTVPVPGNNLAARIMEDLAEINAHDAASAAAARAAPAPRPTDRVVAFDHPPLGATGTLVAHVIATTDDYDWGDSAPELRLPKPGERVVLGSGTLFTEEYMGAPVIGVRPNDGRETEWMDRNAISRCKDHLVRLEFELPKDSAPAAGAARRVQAARQEGGLQPAAQAAQHGFPAANPLAPPGRAASAGRRAAAARTGSPPQGPEGPPSVTRTAISNATARRVAAPGHGYLRFNRMSNPVAADRLQMWTRI